jgi:site-specific recombinase XerD
MKNLILPFATQPLKPADSVGFSFFNILRDKMGTKYIDYKPAKIKKGKRWYVEYSFKDPSTSKFKRFKVYEEINRLKGQEQEDYAKLLCDAVNYGLKNGYDPFHKEILQVAVKNWTLIQGLNYFKQHLYTRGLRTRTIETYESVLKMLYRELDPIKNELLKDLTRQQITSALRNAKARSNKKTKGKWSNGTYNNNVTFTRAIFGFLMEEELTTFNPAKYVKKLPHTVTKHRYFDDNTFKRIKESADPELLSFMMFIYHTATRPRSEALKLTDKNILRESKQIFIPASISKNKKDDYIDVTDYVIKNYTQQGRLFPRSLNFFAYRFNKLRKKLGLSSAYTIYAMKHTRCCHMALAGVDPYSIMKFFRHSNLNITHTYMKDLGISLNRTETEKGIRF